MDEHRELGLWESYCAIAHDVASGTGNTCMVIHLHGDLDFELLRKAFKKIYLKHPLLRAIIKKKNDYSFYLNAKFNEIPLHQEYLNNEFAWMDRFALELKDTYPTDTYLWRARLLSLKNSNLHYLLISLHHAILDGISQIAITHDLLTYYQQLHALQDDAVHSLPFLAPIEQLFPKETKWNEYILALNKIDHDFGPELKLPFNDFAVSENTMPRIILCDFDNIILQKLISACKLQSIRINSAINAALLLAAQEQLKEPSSLSLYTAANLRRYAKPEVGNEHIGCFISVVKTIHRNVSIDRDFYTLAKDYQQQFDLNFKYTGFPPAKFDIEIISQFFRRPEKNGRKHFENGFGISNWGSVNLPETYGPLKLLGIHRGSGRQIGDFPFFFHIASINNKIFGAFSFVEPLMSETWMKNYINHFRNIMHSINLPS